MAGRAIVQTYAPGHRVMVAVEGGDAEGFYAAELELRRRIGSPPFGRLVKLTVSLPERDAAKAEATRMASTRPSWSSGAGSGRRRSGAS